MNLFPEFERNARSRELQYDVDKVASQRVLVIGANPLSEQIITQLLVFGFKDIHLWSHERTPDGSKAIEQMRRLEHISPYFRNAQGLDTLAARTVSTSFDSLGFKHMARISPAITINTENNSYLSDVLATRTPPEGLYIDAHTMSDHARKLYGMNIQCMIGELAQNFTHMERRDLSVFDGAPHDPLLSRICASYVGAFAARHTLKNDIFFLRPTSLTLFPFADEPMQVGAARKEVHYGGFFKDKSIYLAGLGGGSLMLDALVDIFNVDKLWGVDKDRLERTNLNRLVPFIDDRLVGRKKTEAARIVYGHRGRDLRFIDGVIDDDLLIGDDQYGIDIMLGMLSGFDNKLNLIALSQKLSQRKEHLLVDVGVEPFRFDVTNYLAGTTPCDHCRNLHDLAVTEYLSGHVPNCDAYVPGSTIFANSLGALGIIEAMKYVDPALGPLITGSLSGDLLPAAHDPARLYAVKRSPPSSQCTAHMRMEPLHVDMSRYELVDDFETGWNCMKAYELPARRFIGSFRYTPGVRGE